MLFDPSFADRHVVADATASWQPACAAAARHRSSPCVLTLPDISAEIPAKATLRWRSDASLDAVVLAQFRHGPLHASDVADPASPIDAFQQAFFAWARRQLSGPTKMISFGLDLFDTNAVNDVIQHQYDREEFKPDSPLHLGVKLTDEWMHEIGVLAQPLREAHPLLLYTLFNLVDRVSGKTVLFRTPGWFLCEAACMHWAGDESASDEDALEWLLEMYGDEEQSRRYLPSVLRPELCPDEVRVPTKIEGRRARLTALAERELLELHAVSTDMVANVCRELVALHRLLRRAGKHELFMAGYDARPIYSGCTLVLEHTERTGEMLDDHINNEYQAGEASEYSRFISFSKTRQGIREQYAQWSLALRMLHHLDRLLALVVST
ncbi:PRTRC system protein F [Paraburkholderia sabiae]|uniref:PRTRC system protein F n=1 Tax=Paraburkholderia sabiae TaxID=273251 RepID=A0ABU9QJN4_9BURK|nr:PRTRC system protein F [Paraburkholderia sabiae]WJZ79783.1 PRTRC system protein F [Paraburkholderia sabiae]